LATSAQIRQTRNLLLGLTLALLASGMVAAPALAATATPFAASIDERATFVRCPPGTPAGALCFVGEGDGSVTLPLPGGPAKESFFGFVDFGATKAGCTPDYTWSTVSTTKGSLTVFVRGMKCDATPGVDHGAWTVLGGTGMYGGARGSGTAVSQVTSFSNTGATSTSTFDGTLILSH